MWTSFWDMHSGGGTKEKPYEKIYIEAGKAEACIIFQNRFGHNPQRVTCTCCGEDYAIDESETLAEATGYQRGCHYDEKKKKYVDKPDEKHHFHQYKTVKQYATNPDVLIIRKKDIKPEERVGELRRSGYVWVD